MSEPAERVAWGWFLLGLSRRYPCDRSVYAWIVSRVTPAAGRGTPEQESLHNEAIIEWDTYINGTAGGRAIAVSDLYAIIDAAGSRVDEPADVDPLRSLGWHQAVAAIRAAVEQAVGSPE